MSLQTRWELASLASSKHIVFAAFHSWYICVVGVIRNEMSVGRCFSFFSDEIFTFEIDSKHELKGHLKRLNTHLARLYFSRHDDACSSTDALDADTSKIEVKDMTLGGLAAKMPSTNDYILSWSSNYLILYEKRIVFEMKACREYHCFSFCV